MGMSQGTPRARQCPEFEQAMESGVVWPVAASRTVVKPVPRSLPPGVVGPYKITGAQARFVAGAPN